MIKRPPRQKISRSSQEIEELYLDQLEHLQSSCHRFDRGKSNEYRRIATALRVIAYDSRTSQSLIKQRGLETRQFLTCARPLQDNNKLDECDLIELVLRPQRSTPATWRAVLDNAVMEFVDFQSWWMAPVMTDQVSAPFSRSDIVTYVANQDGGAHVDPAIDAAFEKMRTDGFQWTNGREITGQPERHALRQIGHELLKSLQPSYSRTRSNDEPLASFRGLSVAEDGSSERPDVQGYHLALVESFCPCGSGSIFAACHGLGVTPPRVENKLSFKVQAPPGAAYARVHIVASPDK